MSQEQEARERRAARNQSLFRDLNEQIEKLQHSAMYREFACECCDESCVELVPLTIEEYETVRHESNSFLVLRGHEEPARERVIAEGDRFVVVAKTGAGAALAEELDPRALEVPAEQRRHDPGTAASRESRGAGAPLRSARASPRRSS